MQPKTKGRFASVPIEERFWAKVKKTDTCWVWQATINPQGYGKVYYQGRNQSAHRVSYLLSNGEIPAGKELDHLCRNRACVNPAHLEAVTHAVNMQRSPLNGNFNRRKTHCKYGHEFNEQNTLYWDNRRHCRPCNAARYHAKKLRLNQQEGDKG